MAQAKNISEVSDQSFDNDVLKSGALSLVDFWAEWCGPCRMLAPTIEGLADQYQGKVKVFKMDVDQNPNTPGKYHIRGIPTVILFKNGQVLDQLVGNQPKEAFVQTIEKHLG
ncbi:MAG: thioredoxin [Bdellovibrionales bacterium]|nr:thioredoxin [Bdellovibrionales bacterium]